MRGVMRQGDVLLIPVSAERAAKAREAAREVEHGGEFVLAEGEITGHAHRLSGRLERFESSGGMFVSVEEDDSGPGWLRHEEHRDFPVPAGTYEVRIQREYTEENDRASFTRVMD